MRSELESYRNFCKISNIVNIFAVIYCYPKNPFHTNDQPHNIHKTVLVVLVFWWTNVPLFVPIKSYTSPSCPSAPLPATLIAFLNALPYLNLHALFCKQDEIIRKGDGTET